ncbi:MAG: ATP-binding protein, partial [Deltaproteobacteria bacterium]|nr:ATP-binding protein [Deltaproteobacteria bacterium]
SILRLSLENISLEEILKRSLDLILSIPWLVFESRGCIFLVEDTPEVLVMKAQNGLAKPIQMSCAQVPFGKCLCGRTASTAEIYFADHIDDAHEIVYEGIIPHGHYCVPIMSDGVILGVLNVYVKEGHPRNKREEEFLTAIANTLTGIIIRNRGEKEIAALQEQFRQSQKMEAIGQLAGGIAHDFNNLLTVISGYSELSLSELKGDGDLRENIEEIKKAARRASDLTRQLLAFSRCQILEVKVLDLNIVLRDLDKMLRRVIGEDIELVTTYFENLERIKTDRGQIEQVIMNLAINAKDAMPSGGKLTIETANIELDEEYARSHIAVTPGRYVMLSVSDTGVGMTPEVRDRVFEPFFTTKEKDKGTGLGLSTVYGIVKQSGGNIWVYSEPGRGTTFKIYLPRMDEPLDERVERMVEKERPGGDETILLVEDDKEVRMLAVRILKTQGYRVLEASHGGDALQVLKGREGSIHLLVTDVVMPEMSGRELANRLIPFHPKMKVLYMSGYTDSAIVHHGILDKGVNYIQKPFTVDGLARKVREVLDN